MRMHRRLAVSRVVTNDPVVAIDESIGEGQLGQNVGVDASSVEAFMDLMPARNAYEPPVVENHFLSAHGSCELARFKLPLPGSPG
jgi:hypothetical protein